MSSSLPAELPEDTPPSSILPFSPGEGRQGVGSVAGVDHPVPAPPSPRQSRVQAVERAARGSVLGCLLQPLLAVVSHPNTCSLQMANTMQRNLSRLAELSAQVSGVGLAACFGGVVCSVAVCKQ